MKKERETEKRYHKENEFGNNTQVEDLHLHQEEKNKKKRKEETSKSMSHTIVGGIKQACKEL